MATKFSFNNKVIGEPGVYSQVKSGIKNPPLSMSYGNILIIDTGKGAGYGSGSGILGGLKKGKDSIQSFDNLGDFQDKVRGGLYWHLAEYLFLPNGFNFPGVSKVYFVKAATTTPAEITYNFGDELVSDSDSDSMLDGGTITFQVRAEGTAGNGVETYSSLTRGYCGVMKKSPNYSLTNKVFVMEFWAGTYKGVDNNGLEWDNIVDSSCPPELIATSVEFKTVKKLGEWGLKNAKFNQYFRVKSYTTLGSGRVDDKDLLNYATNNLASGGTETYNSNYLNDTLDAVASLDYTFVLATDYGIDGVTGAESANNGKILAHIMTQAKYQKYMIVGGGNDEDEFDSTGGSIDIAKYYNSSRVIVVHAGIKRALKTGGFKNFESITKTAAVLGRICGLQPQVPATFKSITMDADMHDMTDIQRQKALDFGVLHTKYDDEFGRFVINQSINSIQENTYEVNTDGSSHEISIERIAAQVNKLIVFNAKKDLLSQEAGVNRNTLTAVNVSQWLKSFLISITATASKDNLIISFQNINVTVQGDAYFITYEFVPNFPVNKLFFTGVMIDKNV